ncbi:MAG: adenylyltransferase/cytidyltransferase family protein [Treponema sp.]|nr:adenylyltransferase/cytidyltransferase family protein [Treponema sp.]
MSEEKIIGYTTGVYDLFHIGHLNLLKNAKGMCDYLVVGVTVDELVAYKGKQAMIPFEDRIEIVRSCKYVDAAVPQYDMDKLTACKKLGAKVLFVGDDWYGTDKWKEYEKKFEAEGIKIVYFPYTKGISSTKITEALQQVRGWTDESAQKALHINGDDKNDR